MLDSLRKSADGWVVKALMGILVVSFAFWGVSGFHTEKTQTVAVVGGQEISVPEFNQTYQTELRALSAQYNRNITSTQARALGLPQKVVHEMVGNAAMGIHAAKLRLGIDDAALRQQIQSDPAFANASGEFDPDLYRQALQNLELNERYYLKLRREEAIRGQVLAVMKSGTYVPQTMLDAANHYLNDQRIVKYFIVPATAAGTIEAPDENALKTYYDGHKTAYVAPQYRKIGMLLLTPDSIKDQISIPEAEIKASYENNKKKYGTPEVRTIQQLVFKDKASAEAARAKLTKDTDFVKFGAEISMKEGDVNIGSFSQDKLADKKIAEAVFKLKKGEISGVIEGFTPVIMRVTEIKAATQKSYDEAKDEVRNEIAKARAAAILRQKYDEVEDTRGGGATLAEAGKKLGVKYDEYTFDASGNGMDGNKVETLVTMPEVIKLAFNSEVGVENNPLSVSGGSAFADVREVIPERQKPLAEVQESVKKAWTEEETRKRIEKKVQDLMARATGGEKLDKLAETVDTKVAATPLIKRGDVQPGLPVTAIAQAFSLPLNGFAYVSTPDRKSFAVMQVIDIKPAAALDEKQAASLRDTLSRSMSSDFQEQYVNGLKNVYGVQFNNKVISELAGQQ